MQGRSDSGTRSVAHCCQTEASEAESWLERSTFFRVCCKRLQSRGWQLGIPVWGSGDLVLETMDLPWGQGARLEDDERLADLGTCGARAAWLDVGGLGGLGFFFVATASG